MNATIQNIVFDLGGVLADLDIERCRASFRALGMPRIADLIDPYYPAEVFEKLERGALTSHEACDEIRRISGRSEATDRQIADAYRSFIVGIPVYKLRMLARLRERGLKLYMLTNNNPLVMPYIVDCCFTADGRTVNDYFDKLYVSYEMHLLKPSPEIFRAMIADSGLVPHETLFIDDGRKNVNAARDLGFDVYMPAPREDFRHLFDDLLPG